jgi:putative endopeptidase
MTNQLKPQNNFYLWQNSEWLNDPKNQIPSDYTSWGAFMKLRDNSLIHQNEILTELVKNYNNLSTDEKKISIIYKKILQKYNEWENNIGNYNELKKEFDILKNTIDNNNFISTLAKYGSHCCINGIGFLFEFDKGSDMKNVENILLDLAPCNLLLPTREYYLDDKFKNQIELFKEHLNNIYAILKNNNILVDKNFASNVLEFEKKLAYIKMTKSQSRLYDQYFTKTNLEGVYTDIENHNFVKDKLENYINEDKEIFLTKEEKESAKIFFKNIYDELQLKKYMENNFDNNFKMKNMSKEMVYDLTIYDGDYFKRLFKLLTDNNNINLCVSWLQYNLVHSLSDYCTKELNEEFFDFYGRKLNGQKEQKSYDKRAVENINSWVGELLGKVYVKKHFSQESKNDIVTMINKVIEMMDDSINNNDWLTSKTKENAKKKLSTFIKKIGFPDVWKKFDKLEISENDTLFEIRNKIKQFYYTTEFLEKINTNLDKTKWLMTPQTVNAYYHPQLNEIVFPAAILQPPFYQSSYESIEMKVEPKEYYEKLGFDPLVPINHGGIIAVIAHEITHGYDDQGRKYDHNGNMIDWWTEEDTKLFMEKTKLMANQAKQYIYTDNNNNIHKMNPDLTMGENLADLGGLTLSLKALLTNKIYNNPEAVRLFFKSWANVWKSNFKEEARINRLASDPHAPVDFRANLVKNIDLFHEVFEVDKKDDMWLESDARVKMW